MASNYRLLREAAAATKTSEADCHGAPAEPLDRQPGTLCWNAIACALAVAAVTMAGSSLWTSQNAASELDAHLWTLNAAAQARGRTDLTNYNRAALLVSRFSRLRPDMRGCHACCAHGMGAAGPCVCVRARRAALTLRCVCARMAPWRLHAAGCSPDLHPQRFLGCKMPADAGHHAQRPYPPGMLKRDRGGASPPPSRLACRFPSANGRN